jgi:predicted nucleic acid-binding protein
MVSGSPSAPGSPKNVDLAAVDPPCRDPGDSKFVALALASEADTLVSSDEDLLVFNPWRGIQILAPTEFYRLRK